MKMTYKKLLSNIYYKAVYHRDLHSHIMNDLLRDDLERKKSLGYFDAYSAIIQMIDYYDTIGSVDYKKVYKMKEELPYFLNFKKQKNMEVELNSLRNKE